MKLNNIKIVLLIVLSSLLVPFAVFAQTEKGELEPNKIIYYFTKEGEISKQREGSEYYRKLLEVNADGSHLVQDFYTEGDKKQMDPALMQDGNALDSWDPKNLQGTLVYWSKTGHKEATINYKAGKKEGALTEWYENGNKKAEMTFVNDLANGLLTAWHENGEKEMTGEMLNDQYEGLWTFWDEKGVKKELVFSRGEIIENKRTEKP